MKITSCLEKEEVILVQKTDNDMRQRVIVGLALLAIVLMMFPVPLSIYRGVVLTVVGAVCIYELIMIRRFNWLMLGQVFILAAGLRGIWMLFEKSWQWVLVLIVATAATDVVALLVGHGFKKRWPEAATPLSKHSPSKTREGALGGIIAGATCGWLMMWGLNTWAGLSVNVWHLVLVAIVPVVAICGDLYESRFKRSVSIDDTSNLLLGHGGVIDRVDSLAAVFATIGMVLYLII